MGNIVFLAQDHVLPVFPSLDKRGAEFSATGHTSQERWALLPTLKTPPEIIRMPWPYGLRMFSFNN